MQDCLIRHKVQDYRPAKPLFSNMKKRAWQWTPRDVQKPLEEIA